MFLLSSRSKRREKEAGSEGPQGWRPSKEVTGLPPAGRPLLPRAKAEGKASRAAACLDSAHRLQPGWDANQLPQRH